MEKRTTMILTGGALLVLCGGITTTYGCSAYLAWYALPAATLVATMILVETFIDQPGVGCVLATILLVSASLLVTSVVEPLVPRNEVGTSTYLKVADLIRGRPDRRECLADDLLDRRLDNREALAFFRAIDRENSLAVIEQPDIRSCRERDSRVIVERAIEGIELSVAKHRTGNEMKDPVFTVVMAIILALLLVIGLAIVTGKPSQQQVELSKTGNRVENGLIR